MNALLDTLSALQVERYNVVRNANWKLFSLEKPAASLSWISAGAKAILAIGGVVGGTDGKKRYARVAGTNRTDVLILSAANTARLTRNRAASLAKM